jgi:uncharacterized membrane protein YccC
VSAEPETKAQPEAPQRDITGPFVKDQKRAPWSALLQTVLRFEKEKITPWLGVRNTLGFTLPLAVGVAIGMVPGAIAMSTGALNVAFTDSREPYILRARRMLAGSALVGLAVLLGTLFGRNHTVAILLTGVWAFAAGLLVCLSTTAADLGVMSLVTLIVFSASPQPPDRAIYAGLLALAGGLLQTLITLALWPLRRRVPERRALGDLFMGLANAAATPVESWRSFPASEESTRAQNSLAMLSRGRSVESERFRLLLSQAERMRLRLLMLTRLRIRIQRERSQSIELDLLDRFFSTASRLLLSISASILAAVPPAAAKELLADLETMAEDMRRWDPVRSAQETALLNDARIQMDALNGQFRATVELASNATPAGLEAFGRREAAQPWRLRLAGTLATLRANLTLESAACRHAVRLAVCVVLGDTLARGLSLQRPYWLPMTVAIVLKPDFTATFSRGVLRLAGTFVGLVVATGLFHVLPPAGAAQVALMAIFMFVMRGLGAANYGVLVVAVTALVAMLISLTGVPPKDVIASRALNTLAGGSIALVAYWLWPTWERSQAGERMAQLIDAYREYFRLIRESYMNPGRSYDNELDGARLAGRLARSNLEATVDRASAEPGTTPETIRLLNGMLASLHRLAQALMALESGLANSSPVPARAAFQPFADNLERTLDALAAALRGSPLRADGLPDLREYHLALVHSGNSAAERYAMVNVETDRITNSVNTYKEELIVWLAAQYRRSVPRTS